MFSFRFQIPFDCLIFGWFVMSLEIGSNGWIEKNISDEFIRVELAGADAFELSSFEINENFVKVSHHIFCCLSHL